MCMKNIALLVILTILLAFPYQFFGEEAGTHFFFSSLLLYFMAKKKIKMNHSNKGYIFLLLFLMLYAAVVAIISVNPIRSLYGVSLYACMLLAFLIAKDFQEEIFMKYFIYISSILAAIASFYQGFVEQIRIYGNLGYANTYALVLSISFILSHIYENIKGRFYIKIILVLAIMLTGDRVAIILLGVWGTYYTITERKLNSFVSLLFGILCYAFFSLVGAAAIVVAPPIIWLLNEAYKRMVKWNLKIVFCIAFILLGSVFTLLDTNTFERIKNISWNNPSLLERMISFEDVLKQTPDALLGRGANSYEYSQYLYKSAFYESKYIHNIFLQHLYDFGVIGALLFFAFVLYGGYTIVSSSHKYKKEFLAIYIVVIIHGMWNFDIVFPVVFVFISIIIAFCSGAAREFVVMNRLVRPLTMVVFLFFMLLAVHEGAVRVADMSIRKEKPAMAQTLITLQRRMNIPDERVYFIQAAVEKWKYDQFRQSSFLHHAKENLEKAQMLNEVDPRIKWNLAYILTENKEFAKAEKLWNEVLKREGKNKETYRMYVQFLNKAYARDKEEKNKKIEELKKIHDMNRKSLHPKALFLPNQLKSTLELTLRD
jgi:hypothetical protein